MSPIKTYRPTTPVRRYITTPDFSDITAAEPHRPLTRGKPRISGRGHSGRITLWHRGGGPKRLYRQVSFRRDKFGVPARVATVEYDPNRSARICLLHYADGEKRYILQAEGLKPGDIVQEGPGSPIAPGNALPLSEIPVGSFVHNLEIAPGGGGKLVRAAGTSAQVMAREGGWATLRMPSGEIRMFSEKCFATVGAVGNAEHGNITLGKAGRSRHLGRRPHTRGTAMNPVDHPHGGGRGKSKGANHPQSPSGVPAKGYRTRPKRKYSDRWILVRRQRAKLGGVTV